MIVEAILISLSPERVAIGTEVDFPNSLNTLIKKVSNESIMAVLIIVVIWSYFPTQCNIANMNS